MESLLRHIRHTNTLDIFFPVPVIPASPVVSEVIMCEFAVNGPVAVTELVVIAGKTCGVTGS